MAERNTPASASALKRSLATAAWLGLFGLAAALSLQETRALDYWWHLRTGELIFETASVPKVDPYSYTVPGARWIDVHWLHQLGLYGLYSLGGHEAVSLAKLAAVGLMLALLASIGARRARPLVSVLPLSLMLIVAADRFEPRPEISTFVLLAAMLALFARHRRKHDRWIYIAALIQLVWVNVHGLFPLGIGICGAHLLSEIAHTSGSLAARARSEEVQRLLLVTGLVILVSLLNPNGLEGALYPLGHLQMLAPADQRDIFGVLIAELAPLFSSRSDSNALVVFLVMLLSALSLLAMLLNWSALRVADLLLWLAFLLLALSATRNAALFAIVAAPIAVRNLNEFLDRRHGSALRSFALPAWLPSASQAAVPLLLLLLTADVLRDRFFPRLGSGRQTGVGVMEHAFPIEAVEWIAREAPHARLCHQLDTGGYLIWRRHPHQPVMLDGRLEVYGTANFRELLMLGSAQFRAVDARHGCGAVLLQHNRNRVEELIWWLHLAPEWSLRFVDDVAVVFVRTAAGDSDAPATGLDLDSPELFPPFTGPPGVEDRDRRVARMRLYASLHRFRPALAIWEQALERYPDLPLAAFTRAALLYQTGRRGEADGILQRLASEHDRDVDMLIWIAELRLEREARRAAKLFDAALALDPDRVEALLGRGRAAELMGDLGGALHRYRRFLEAHPLDPRSQEVTARIGQLEAIAASRQR